MVFVSLDLPPLFSLDNTPLLSAMLKTIYFFGLNFRFEYSVVDRNNLGVYYFKNWIRKTAKQMNSGSDGNAKRLRDKPPCHSKKKSLFGITSTTKYNFGRGGAKLGGGCFTHTTQLNIDIYIYIYICKMYL